jgi:hypothetical protein
MARSTLLLAVIAVVLAALSMPLARAQEPISVIAEAARNEFPAGVTFTISVRAPADTEDVRLRYELAPDGTGATGLADCTGGATTNCTFSLTSGRGIWIIPGAEITYHWEIEDAEGNELSTAEQLYVHEDPRFTFRTVADENVTVYYSGDTDSATAVLGASVQTLEEVEALTRTQVEFPVKVFLYETAADMQPAIAPAAGRGVRVLGEVVYSDTAMVSADVDMLEITRHEIAHIVTREAVKGPFDVPVWLHEGVSEHAQTGPLAGEDVALRQAIASDTVFSLAQLQSTATRGVASSVSLFYGQSGAIVTYIIDTYGPEKFADLLATFRQGSTVDNAFEMVYGFDQFGLENEWRESVGLEARDAPATEVPDPANDGRADPESPSGADGEAAAASDGDGAPIITIAIIALLAIIATGAAFATYRVARQRL